ncbi:hypothetical protein [Brevundimonas sp.]|uniref:hypothetical protein n=1 Tax=Brevundimonas sp. TaxID=1871086 RepID=UPI001A1A9656|nr:hypothetical protein [Brevundimonas sp.]MBJ7486363.1 hypothetical protein [Brevundimonas sp.]
MAGMKDEAGRAMQGRCWAEDHMATFQSMVDEGVEALKDTEWKRGDVLAIERKFRAIGTMARTVKLVEGLRPKPSKFRTNDKHHEDEMSEGAANDADDRGTPEFERMRQELERRLARLRTNVEAKRADCRDYLAQRDARTSGGDLGVAQASDQP